MERADLMTIQEVSGRYNIPIKIFPFPALHSRIYSFEKNIKKVVENSDDTCYNKIVRVS